MFVNTSFIVSGAANKSLIISNNYSFFIVKTIYDMILKLNNYNLCKILFSNNVISISEYFSTLYKYDFMVIFILFLCVIVKKIKVVFVKVKMCKLNKIFVRKIRAFILFENKCSTTKTPDNHRHCSLGSN